MILSMILAILVTLIISYFFWAFVHEGSHVVAASLTSGIQWFKIMLFPHKYKGTFRFAGCEYLPKREMTKEEYGFVSFAPRIPDLIAAIALPMAGFFDFGVYYAMWITFWTCGLVDFFIGSLGISKYSDLRRASACFNISPWILRVFGFSVIAISAFITIVDIIIKF